MECWKCRNSRLLADWGCVAVLVLAQTPLALWAQAERQASNLLIQAQAARRQGDLWSSMELAMQALLQQPKNEQARKLMREAAKDAAQLEIGKIQQERRQLLEQSRQKHNQMEHVQVWQGTLDKHMKKQDTLKAYDFLYELLETKPEDPWPKAALEKLQQNVIFPGSADQRYKNAVLGFHYYTKHNFPQARDAWFIALIESGSPIPEERILKYFTSIEEALKSSQSPILSPPAKEIKPAIPKEPVAPKPKVRAKSSPDPDQQEDQARNHYLLGLTHYGQGRLAEAIKEWWEVLEIQPNHAQAQRAIEKASREMEATRP